MVLEWVLELVLVLVLEWVLELALEWVLVWELVLECDTNDPGVILVLGRDETKEIDSWEMRELVFEERNCVCGMESLVHHEMVD